MPLLLRQDRVKNRLRSRQHVFRDVLIVLPQGWNPVVVGTQFERLRRWNVGRRGSDDWDRQPAPRMDKAAAPRSFPAQTYHPREPQP